MKIDENPSIFIIFSAQTFQEVTIYFTQLTFIALIIADEKPSCSNSLMPRMVIPPGVVTLSISTDGCVSLFKMSEAAPFTD